MFKLGMHRIVKLSDAGYRKSEENVTPDIRYPVGYLGRQFFESDILYFPDIPPDSGTMSFKKKIVEKKL